MKTMEERYLESQYLANAISAVADYICCCCAELTRDEITEQLSSISANVAEFIGDKAECLAADILFSDEDPDQLD